MKKLACIITILAFTANTFAASAGIACAGRISKTTGGYEITYFITDHLGSTRVITGSNGEVKEQNDYYPFGMRHENSNLMTSTNRYLFSGKELQTTGGINYMDFGSRMYDDFLGRWFAIDPMAEEYYPLIPYAYCGNNPVNIIDPDGEFLGAIFGAVGGFFNGLFSGENVFKSTWNGLKNGFKIDMGWLKGDFGQILSRFTWEFPQTLLGYGAGVLENGIFGVNSVTYYGGATVIESRFGGWGAFTLGSYINAQRGTTADPHNSLFQHEYGHYLQSQEMGWGYISRVAVPSLIDGIFNGKNHDYQPFEQDANRRAFMYFNEHEEGFYQTEAEYQYNFHNRIRKGWDFYNNPLDVYHKGDNSRGNYYDYRNPDHRMLIENNLKMTAKWYDYIGGFIPSGIANGIYYQIKKVK